MDLHAVAITSGFVFYVTIRLTTIHIAWAFDGTMRKKKNQKDSRVFDVA